MSLLILPKQKNVYNFRKKIRQDGQCSDAEGPIPLLMTREVGEASTALSQGLTNS